MHPSALPHRALRIAISCERRLFRDALADCLTKCSDFIVVGHVAGVDDLLELCELSCPDVVVLDVSRRLADGLNVLRALRSRCPQTTVVMAYDHLGPKEMKTALRSGVNTLVPCSHGLDALLTILRRGEYAVGVRDDQLTELDREILTLTGAGHPVGRIAELLGVSAGTVENCKRRLYHKLDVTGQSQAVARAAALGLIARTPRPAIAADQPDAMMLVLLRGDYDLTHDYVIPALLADGVPYTISKLEQPSEVDQLVRLHPGPVLLVLVDPAPQCWLGAEGLGIPIALVRSAPVDRVEMLDALDRGVAGIVSADQIPGEQLVSVLTQVARGHLVLAVPEALAAVGASEALRHNLPELTARETDILRSIGCGHTVRQTARILGIAEKTVENTQARLFRKLGARNRAAAFAAAHAFGLID